MFIYNVLNKPIFCQTPFYFFSSFAGWPLGCDRRTFADHTRLSSENLGCDRRLWSKRGAFVDDHTWQTPGRGRWTHDHTRGWSDKISKKKVWSIQVWSAKVHRRSHWRTYDRRNRRFDDHTWEITKCDRRIADHTWEPPRVIADFFRSPNLPELNLPKMYVVQGCRRRWGAMSVERCFIPFSLEPSSPHLRHKMMVWGFVKR